MEEHVPTSLETGLEENARPGGLPERRAGMPANDAQLLLRELGVHQVELQAQVDELHDAYADLDAARLRYFDLYDLAPVGYCSVSDTGLILDANLTATTLLGVARTQLIGQTIQHFIAFADRDIYHLYRQKLLATGEPQTCELRLLKEGGPEFWAQLIATDTQGPTGLHTHRLVLTDIDTRRRLAEALKYKNVELQRATTEAQQANSAKSDFLSSMSHELRSPLNAILGFAQLLELGPPAPTTSQQGKIDKILRGGWYLLSLVNEILDLALVESGKLALELEPVSLVPVLLDCQTLVEQQAESKGVALHFPQFARPILVVADPIRLKQVIVNLLTNAIKYNRRSGTVTVAVETTEADRLRISVADTGNGLEAKKISQLFQTFNRLGQESSAIEGTGIGLVVTRRLTELMGGHIGVQSTVGVGSVFWVEFNLAQPSLAKDRILQDVSAALHPPPAVQNQTPYTVLYIEDDLMNGEIVEQILRARTNLKLLRAMDGLQGIALARAHRPDLILMDIKLPGISGVEALKILRQDASTLHIPVVAVSANAMPQDIVAGLSAGFFRYLTKPFKVDAFLAVLDLALALAPPKVADDLLPFTAAEGGG